MQPEPTDDGAGQETPKVFINYRREDTAGDARLVYERLAQRFGRQNVFLDVVDLHPGTTWLDVIKSRGGTSGILIALIGPNWLSAMLERLDSRLERPEQDILKLELEIALSRNSGVEVLPVLVGEASMPPPEQLPRSIRRLAETQATELRHTHYDDDIASLITTLESLAAKRPAEPPAPPPDNRTLLSLELNDPPSPASAAVPRPDSHHYETVVRYMLDQATVVPILGPRVYGALPDAAQIAVDLARRFEVTGLPLELPRVAQEVFVSSGRPDLTRTLRRILSAEREPSSLHRFLARFPQQLEQLGRPKRYQMIITTNYDSTLERAFDAENEPYDQCVYVGTGQDRGRFVHFPFDRSPEVIAVPNRYNGFPIDDFGDLHRTVIVKIHGDVLGGVDGDRWKETFVVTEDQYIDYLAGGAIESLVPFQILAKLTESHCLFLGYSMRDWNLRVFLMRIWRAAALGARSWAIEHNPDVLEKDFWTNAQVECFSAPLDLYVEQLRQHLEARGTVRA
jgi:hypothetical protein